VSRLRLQLGSVHLGQVKGARRAGPNRLARNTIIYPHLLYKGGKGVRRPTVHFLLCLKKEAAHETSPDGTHHRC